MPRLLDSTSTIALILGASDWSKADLGAAPSFARSAAVLHRYLLSPQPGGLGLEPDLVVNMFEDPAPASMQLVRIHAALGAVVAERRDAGLPIRDLLIYYVGHGTVDARENLQFLVRDSTLGTRTHSSIAAADLAQVLRGAAPDQRRLVILDCCFSEAAAKALSATGSLDEAVAAAVLRKLEPERPPPERATVLFCSSPRGPVSLGGSDSRPTLFTGAILSALRDGSRPSQDALSFADLRDDAWDRMRVLRGATSGRPALLQTEPRAIDLLRAPAFPNAAGAPSGPAADAVRAPSAPLARAKPAGAAQVSHATRPADGLALEEQTLATLRRSLAVHVGPIANLLVRNAAKGAEGFEAMCDELAEHVASGTEREDFLRSVRASRPAPAREGLAAGRASATLSGTAGSSAAASRVPAADVIRAEAELARRLGPIARVLVRRAAAQSADAAELWERLAADIGQDDERADFLRTKPT